MSDQRKRSRLATCFVALVILMVVILGAGIVVARFVLTQAERTFGTASPSLPVAQRITLAALILLQADDLTQPTNPQGTQVSIVIQQGESVASIISKLWEAGLISNPGVFRSYLQYTGLDRSLKAG